MSVVNEPSSQNLRASLGTPASGDAASVWLKLDELCDRFEEAWLAGRRPRVEECLADVPEANRAEAVRELLKLEVYYRQKSDDTPSLAEYRQRFPSLGSMWLSGVLQPAKSRGSSNLAADDFSERGITDSQAGLPHVPGYHILELIGRGGMGVVYKARDVALHRLVALKMVSAGELASPEMLERFRAEARAVASLQHPNLVQIHEVGEFEGRPYLAFEYVAGGSLDRRLRGEPQSPRPAAQLIKTIAHAIQYAHSRGIVHRDLKPANILLSAPRRLPANEPNTAMMSGRSSVPDVIPVEAEESLAASGESQTLAGSDAGTEFGRPKVSDFGLAKQLEVDQSQTRTGAILGTPSYMAPEQAAGRSDLIGPATDVYSFGAILYEMLTGRPPFRAPTVIETLDQVRGQEPVSLRSIVRSVPRDLETVCLKCLQKEPARRYESAGALADDLDRFLRDEPVLARPVSTTERTWRWCRRHPLAATLAGLLCVVTIGGFAGILHQWRNAESLRELAEDNAFLARQQRDAARRLRAQAERNEQLAEANQLKAEKNQQAAEAQQQLAEAARALGERVIYLQNVNGANAAMRTSDQARAVALLESCRPDLRHWEWHYAQKMLSHGVQTLAGHTLMTYKAAYSADGKTLITASGDWFTSASGELMFWDAKTLRHLETQRPHAGSILDLAMHPTQPRLATAGLQWYGREPAKLLNLPSGEEIATLNDATNSFAVAISPDGKWLAFAGADGRVRLYDAATGQVVHTLTGHTQSVFAVAFSVDGQRLASGGYDGSIRLWDTVTGKDVRPPITGIGDVRSLAFSPDGELLAAINYMGQVRIWNADDLLDRATLHVNVLGGSGVLFSPDSQWLAITAGDRVQVRDPMTGKSVYELGGHRHRARLGAFSPDGRFLVSVGADRLVRVSDLTAGPETQTVSVQGSTIADFDISPDGRLLATAATQDLYLRNDTAKCVRLWSLDENRERQRLTGPTAWLTCTAFSPDGSQVAAGTQDRMLWLWNVEDGMPQQKFVAHGGQVLGIAYSPDGQLLASAGADRLIKLWDPQSGTLQRTFEGHSQPVTRVLFTRDNEFLISGADGGELRVWPLIALSDSFSLEGHRDSILALAVSPDQRWLATGGGDSRIFVWDLTSVLRERESVRPVFELSGHVSRVTGLAFSPDSQRLAATSANQGVLLWDVPTGQPACELSFTNHPLSRVRFSDDGHQIVATSRGLLCKWDDRPQHVPTPEEREQQSINWHLRELRAAELRGLPFAVMHHFRQLPESSVDKNLRGKRAAANARLGNWTAAADDCEWLARDNGPQSLWHFAALLRLRHGDSQAYRELCRGLRDKFHPPASPNDANRMAWTWCLGENATEELQPLWKSADEALARITKADERGNTLNTLGAALYRMGRYQEAIARLDEAIRERGQGGVMEDWLFLAMAHHRLGHAEVAQRWLEQARTELEKPKPPLPPNQRRRAPNVWELPVIHELLFREAERLIVPNGNAAPL